MDSLKSNEKLAASVAAEVVWSSTTSTPPYLRVLRIDQCQAREMVTENYMLELPTDPRAHARGLPSLLRLGRFVRAGGVNVETKLLSMLTRVFLR